MFWRFASNQTTAPVRHVLLVNRAEVVKSVCHSCGHELVREPAGESILVAGPDTPGDRIYHYCASCADEVWVPTLSGRRMKRYSLEWAMPLRTVPASGVQRIRSTDASL